MSIQGNYVTVDPGYNEAGWVSWRDREVHGAGIVRTSDRKWPWHQRALEVASGLNSIVTATGAYAVYCEMPKHMPGSARGRASAQDVVRLAYMVGILSALVESRTDWFLVDVNDWKGNMDKPAVEKRVRRILGEDVIEKFKIRKHMFDALGIGLKQQGRF